MKLQAAISPCPNDVFIFSGLLAKQVYLPGDPELEFSFHDLETMNLEIQHGAWDLAKISYANFPFCSNAYALLRCGGALGRGCGPLLLSNRSKLDLQAPVLVPGRFTTANFLLDFYLQGKPVAKNFLAFDELYRRLLQPEPCQGVVIHEMRFTYADDGLHLVADLGEFWERTTGFPIPLGAVVIRKRLEEDLPEIRAQVEGMIRRSLDWAYAHPESALEMCRHHAQSLSTSVLNAHIELYVNSFTQDIGEEGEAAIQHFFAHANRLDAA